MSSPPTSGTNPPTPSPQLSPEPRRTSARKLFLLATAVLLVGWFSWLGFTALTKSREPIVSHAQAAAASVAVVVAVKPGDDGQESRFIRPGDVQGFSTAVLIEKADKPAFLVTVIEPLTKNAPATGTIIGIPNITACTGFNGGGDYLLLLNPVAGGNLDNHPAYVVVGQQKSPGADLEGIGSPMIYKWGPGVQAQVRQLFP